MTDPPIAFRHPVMAAAEAKSRRAFANLQLLRAHERTILESGDNAVAVEFDKRSGWWIAKLGMTEEPSPDLGVLVGDIAYQCLSGFNIIVWELAARKIGWRKVSTKKFRNHVQVPIALTRRAFDDNPLVTRRLVSRPALAVLNGLQPYEEGYGPAGPAEHPLPLIKEIADSDKHRVITPRLFSTDLSAVRFRWNANVASDPEHVLLVRDGGVIDFGAPILKMRFRKGNEKANVEVDRQPQVSLVFRTDNWSIQFWNVQDIARWTLVSLLKLDSLFTPR